MNTAHTLKQLHVLNLSTQAQALMTLMTSVTDISLIFLKIDYVVSVENIKNFALQ